MPGLIVMPDNNALTVNTGNSIALNNQQISYINNELARGNQITIDSFGTMTVTPLTASTIATTIWGTNSFTTTSSTNFPIYRSIGTATATTSTFNSCIYFNGTTSYANTYGSGSIWIPPKLKRGPLIKKSVKSSIKRAMKLISNFGMEEDVRIFLGGDKVEVSHSESPFKFIISKYPNSLIRHTERASHSTPYKLELYSKTNIHVANLCVIMQDTPLLDQVLALAMFVKTGNEEAILHKANYSSLCSDVELRRMLSNDDPILEKKLRVNDVNISDARYR